MLQMAEDTFFKLNRKRKGRGNIPGLSSPRRLTPSPCGRKQPMSPISQTPPLTKGHLQSDKQKDEHSTIVPEISSESAPCKTDQKPRKVKTVKKKEIWVDGEGNLQEVIIKVPKSVDKGQDSKNKQTKPTILNAKKKLDEKQPYKDKVLKGKKEKCASKGNAKDDHDQICAEEKDISPDINIEKKGVKHKK